MTIKLERHISEEENEETKEIEIKIYYRIRKSFIRSLVLTPKELIELKNLIKKEYEKRE